MIQLPKRDRKESTHSLTCFNDILYIFSHLFVVRLLLFACIYFLVKHGTLQRYYIAHTQSHQLSFLCYLLGNFLDPSSCHVDWLWNGKIPVGQTMKFVIKVSIEKNFVCSNQMRPKLQLSIILLLFCLSFCSSMM